MLKSALLLLCFTLSALSAFADTPPPVYQFNSPLTKSGIQIGCQTFGVSQAGCIPQSGGGTTNFLRADGSWAAPATGSSYTFSLPLLNTAGVISANIFGVSTNGIVPASGGGTTNYLRADGTWAAPTASAPTGNANNAAFFNASGVLYSDAQFRYYDSYAQIILGQASSGATSGNIGTASAGPTFVMGNVSGISSILSTAYGIGNIAFGNSLTNGQLSAQGDGSIAGGKSSNAGIVATELDASMVEGRADGSGSQVSANGVNAIAFGYADSGSVVGAVGNSAFTHGWATGASTLTSTTGKYGQTTSGYSASAGNIFSGGNGASTNCYADSTGTCSATGDGSLVNGRSHGTSTALTASGVGATALGYANSINITASGNGSLAGGSPAAGTTTASGVSAIAWGDNVTSSGNVSTTFGLGSSNPSYAAIVGGKYASVVGTSSTSWVATDTLFALGNGSVGTPANAFSVLKNGTVTAPTFVGALTGNSSTATALAATPTACSTGQYASSIAANGNLTCTQVATTQLSGSITNAQTTATSANTASAIVARDGSGNFSAGTVTATHLAPNGGVGAPSYSFTGDTQSGTYLVGAGELGLAVSGAQALDFQKSTSGYGNVGMGGGASLSDGYPLIMQRTNNSSGTYALISNPTAQPNSKAAIQLATDSNNVGELDVFTTSSTVPAYVAAMVIRASGNTASLNLIAGDNSTNYVSAWTAGDYTSTGEALRINADKSIQFMQEIATPATPATSGDKLYFKTDHNLYKMNPSGTEALVGAAAPSVTTVTSSTTVSSASLFILVNSASAVTITLPDATANAGLSWMIKNINTGTVTVNTTSSQLIDGSLTATLSAKYQAASFLAGNGGYNVW